MLQSLDIGKNSDPGVSNFPIAGQSFVNENCRNSRTSHDIDIILKSVVTLDKRNAITLKNFDNDAMSAGCDVILFCSINGQFEVIRKPDSKRMVYKIYILINNNVLSYKS